jgi:nucleoside-diphosphate-sugar epimerase
MRILITGGRGFLGKSLTDWFIKQHNTFTLYCVENGFINPNITHFIKGQEDHILRTQNIDVCYHFAGNPIVKCEKHEEEQLHLDNIILTQKLLSECKQSTKFVFISSATVYGVYNPPPTEHQHLNPKSIYAGTKAAAEQIVKAYYEQKDLKAYIIRPSAVVGKYATHGLVHDIIKKLDSDNPNLELLGDYPGSKKPYLYAPKLCQFLYGIIGLSPGICNIAAPDSIDVEDVANTVMDEYGIRKPIKFLGNEANWNGDDNYVSLNIDIAKTLVSIPSSKQAIRKTVKDILDARLET